MKKLVFGLIATIMIGFSGFANNSNIPLNNDLRTETATLTIQQDNFKAEYKLNSLEDFEKVSNEILKDFEQIDPNDTGDACMVTISMSVTVTVEGSVGVAGGSVSTTVSGSITTSCASVVAAGKKLRSQLIAIAGG